MSGSPRLLLAIISLSAPTLACGKGEQNPDTGSSPGEANVQKEAKGEAEPPAVEPAPTDPAPAEPAPAQPPGVDRPANYPEGFPLLSDGVRDPGYPPTPRPGSPGDFLYMFKDREPQDVEGELTKAAESQGFRCVATGAGTYACVKDTKQVRVSAKLHPDGGTALFVSELPDTPGP